MIFTLYNLCQLELVFLMLALGFSAGLYSLRKPELRGVRLPVSRNGDGDIPTPETQTELRQVNDDIIPDSGKDARGNHYSVNHDGVHLAATLRCDLQVGVALGEHNLRTLDEWSVAGHDRYEVRCCHQLVRVDDDHFILLRRREH